MGRPDALASAASEGGEGTISQAHHCRRHHGAHASPGGLSMQTQGVQVLLAEHVVQLDSVDDGAGG